MLLWWYARADNQVLVVAVYSIFVAFWATLFLEFWKRRQSSLAYDFQVLDFEATERPRPEFEVRV